MKDIPLRPDAAQLLESMRSIGYSHESAVADLIDNSITAGARHIQLRFPAGQPDYLAILDDGRGMTPPLLVEAMRHGSRNSNEVIPEEDLGRFGLGLKTASLSQCRTLTVVSYRDAVLAGCQWSVDYVLEKRDWVLQQMDDAEIRVLPCVDLLLQQKSGTLVLWRALDRLASGDLGDGSVLSERMDVVRRHLSLVFHRFLSESLDIEINGTTISPIDPFLKHYKATQKGLSESVEIDGKTISVKAFTIPHISRLTRAEIDQAGGAEGLRRQQGFYMYRNRRLIIWGTWFRLLRQEELTKLTRIQVDVPNSLDHLWTLDIKKSVASPPREVRDRLKALLPKIVERGKTVQTYRATRQVTGAAKPIWLREEFRDQSVRYRIDRSHPVIESLRSSLSDADGGKLAHVIRAIEESFPGEAFYNDRAGERLGFKNSEATKESDKEHEEYLYDLASHLLEAVAGHRDTQRNVLASLSGIEPFAHRPDITPRIVERLGHEFGIG